MLRNYLVIALRNIIRHKLYSFINIAGLAVGLACVILIILFIVTMVYHMWIGMQEIIIDYVHGAAAKYLALFGNMFFCSVTGLASIYAVLKLPFGV